jgi:hypothetical protein
MLGLMKRIVTLSLIAAASLAAQPYTRGVGVYPGNPKDYFGPVMRVDATTYRNLALHRPAYHSSSYDYNLTAQLVTDGIKETQLPRWVASSTSQQGVLPKNERERLLDRNPLTMVELKGTGGWVQIELGGREGAPEVDRVDIQAFVQAGSAEPGWKCVLSGSDDGTAWKKLGRATGTDRPATLFKASIALAAPAQSRFYRVEVEAPGALAWRVGEVALFDKNRQLEIGGPYDFTSAWMSEGSGVEWVYVDLGARCTFDRVALYWIRRAAEGAIEVSDDAATWRAIQTLPTTTALVDDLKLAEAANARYVRVRMTRPASPGSYILSELEVWGRGGPVAEAAPAPAMRADGRLDLAGGAWRIQRDSLVESGGEALSRTGFDDKDWMVATVPGTELVSYLNAGAIPNPNYADNQNMVSDSFFYADFWYRNEFVAPAGAEGRRAWLNLDGINWKADVFLNGEKIGRIEGGFMRGRFDVTSRLKPGERNALAVRVVKNATPGSVREKTWESPDKNGGALGADNPTYHATIGWDWIPVVRGRDDGIWKDVYLTTSGPVTIDNPFVTTVLPLPDTSKADIHVEATLSNHEAKAVSGTLRGRFGDKAFEMPVALDASAEKTVKATLHLENPKLWWPAGYGEPNLYNVELRFETADQGVSDAKRFEAGVRQFTYSEEGGALRMWINGRRFIARGGNWGFPESMLLYRGREYDVAVRYHADMHFTMIRNWVGQTGDDEFYEACDRRGIVVWQDFWLANPADGPDPDDNDLFLRNVRDYVLRVRNHASMGLYCGRNEGYPPKPIDDGIRKTLAELHPDLHYIPSSADDTVEGHGPYGVLPTRFYFEQRATPKLHSELGMPNIMSLDSVRQTMPDTEMWPQGRMWGLHDFCLNGAQRGTAFRAMIDDGYGGASSVDEWLTLAQFVNYEGHRAMYEAQSRNRMGLLIWMSHPAWPTFVWQTYDYYFEPTAAYFGAKKASEPLHIQWNAATDTVEVVNYSGGNATGLRARAEIRNMDGSLKWEKEVPVTSAEDSDVQAIKMEYPAGLTPVHFIRLRLARGGETVSENFYWRGLKEGDYRALRQLPRVKIEAATRVERQGSRWQLAVDLHNVSSQPALMVKLKVVREKSGDRILPAMYSDNYVALMPGERRTIAIEVEDADTRGEAPRVAVDGFNVAEVVPFRTASVSERTPTPQ